MKNTFRGAILVVAAILAVVWWGSCQRKAGAREALQSQQDAHDDSVSVASAQAFQRERARQDSLLTLYNSQVKRARREVERLRSRLHEVPASGEPAANVEIQPPAPD